MIAPVLALAAATVVMAAPTRRRIASSGKAGVPWPVQEGSAAPMEVFFENSDLVWWYDYNKNYEPSTFPDDGSQPNINAEFIPELFDTSFLNNGAPLEPGWTEIQGYNEPDNSDPSTGSGISPSDACSNWMAAIDQLDPGRTKNWISPSVASDMSWLQNFYGCICPGGLSGCHYAPNYQGVHAYQTDFTSFQNLVTSYYNEFGLDIVVGEFAWANFGSNPQPSQQTVYDYMGQTTQWLDETPWIYKYAWFGACRNAAYLYGVPTENRLMDENGNLTPLGQQYVNGGHS